MRNLLITTDFSLNAYSAAVFAGQVACHIGIRLVIFHALPPVVNQKGRKELVETISAEEAAQKRLDELSYDLRNKYNISVSRLIIPGHAAVEIPALAKRLNAASVIMGKKGERMGGEDDLGSVAVEVLEKCKSPVVCVPNNPQFGLSSQVAFILNEKHQLFNRSGSSFLTELLAVPAGEK